MGTDQRAVLIGNEVRSPWMLRYVLGPGTRVSKFILCSNMIQRSGDVASRPMGRGRASGPTYV